MMRVLSDRETLAARLDRWSPSDLYVLFVNSERSALENEGASALREMAFEALMRKFDPLKEIADRIAKAAESDSE